MNLTERWYDLWHLLNAEGNTDEPLRVLTTHYGEPHRAYHTLAHVQHCLTELDSVLNQCAKPEAVMLALWYHDAVYDPTRHDNEVASAALLRQHTQHWHIQTDSIEASAQYISATSHTVGGGTGDERIITDVDLAILGQSDDVFDGYDEAIRKEYHFVPWNAYAARRTTILRTFLARPSIYATEHFVSRYEQRARGNLDRALERLRMPE